MLPNRDAFRAARSVDNYGMPSATSTHGKSGAVGTMSSPTDISGLLGPSSPHVLVKPIASIDLPSTGIDSGCSSLMCFKSLSRRRTPLHRFACRLFRPHILLHLDNSTYHRIGSLSCLCFWGGGRRGLIKPSPITRSLHENHVASVVFKIWNRDKSIYRIIYRIGKQL